MNNEEFLANLHPATITRDDAEKLLLIVQEHKTENLLLKSEKKKDEEIWRLKIQANGEWSSDKQVTFGICSVIVTLILSIASWALFDTDSEDIPTDAMMRTEACQACLDKEGPNCQNVCLEAAKPQPQDCKEKK